MYLFLFLLFPLSFSVFCLVTKDKKIVPAAVIGFLAAVLVCAVKLFFMHAHRIVPYSLKGNFVYFLIRQTILPVVIVYGLFFAVSRDSVEYKVKSFLPLMLCFYMAFLPYTVVSSGSAIVPAYMIFVKPVVYLAMIFQLSICVNLFYRFANDKKIGLIVPDVLVAVLYLAVPALIESLFVIGTNFMIVVAASVVYCFLPAAYGILKVVAKSKNV